MKKNMLFVTISLIALLFIECSKSSKKFIGWWVGLNTHDKVLIYKEDDLYILEKAEDQKLTFKYSDNSLKGSGMYGDITFSDKSNHIFFAGQEYESINETNRRLLTSMKDHIICQVAFKMKEKIIEQVQLGSNESHVQLTYQGRTITPSKETPIGMNIYFTLPQNLYGFYFSLKMIGKEQKYLPQRTIWFKDRDENEFWFACENEMIGCDDIKVDMYFTLFEGQYHGSKTEYFGSFKIPNICSDQ